MPYTHAIKIGNKKHDALNTIIKRKKISGLVMLLKDKFPKVSVRHIKYRFDFKDISLLILLVQSL
jgi:hypothetical protein